MIAFKKSQKIQLKFCFSKKKSNQNIKMENAFLKSNL